MGRGVMAQVTNASLVVSLTMTLAKVISLTIIVSDKKAFLNRTFCAARINFESCANVVNDLERYVSWDLQSSHI